MTASIIIIKLHVNAVTLGEAAAMKGHGRVGSVVYVQAPRATHQRHDAVGTVVVGHQPPFVGRRAVISILRDGLLVGVLAVINLQPQIQVVCRADAIQISGSCVVG